LVEAWERAAIDSRLEIIGVGPLERDLQRRGIRGVSLLGQLDQSVVREKMLAARALVLPSIWYEGLSMVLLEALAAGLPVLASDIGPIPEVVAPLGAEWLANPGDPDDLAKGLARLADGEAVARGGTAARTLYEERYSESQGLADLESAYKRVGRTISGPRLPRR
jgi:glycosyltransferase involved in cell wall biosynthesis